MFFSELYKQKYTLRNVTGINILEYKRKGDEQAEDTKEPEIKPKQDLGKGNKKNTRNIA
jgi:hypothetical protein